MLSPIDLFTSLSRSICCDESVSRPAPGMGEWTCDNCHGPAYVSTSTEYSVLVTLESGMPPEPTNHGTDWHTAEERMRDALAILTGSTEPVATHADHYPRGTIHAASGVSDVRGAWSVYLTAKDV